MISMEVLIEPCRSLLHMIFTVLDYVNAMQ